MWSSLRRRARPLLRGLVYPAVESAWTASFAVAGRLYHAPGRAGARAPTCAPGAALGGQRVGILAPHPDDETAGCGGMAARHHAAGDRVAVLVLTDGGASRAARLPRAALTARRTAEARAAAGVLGVDALEPAGLPEGAWALPDGAARIARWLATERPTLLYAPSCIDYHPEHLRVAHALTAALATLSPAEQPPIRTYEVFVPLGPALINCVAGIAPWQSIKARALACYQTQAAGLAQVRRRDRYLAAFYGLPGAAEGFCALSAPAYCTLTTRGTWRDRPSPYRGLRSRPFTDPLAYLAGWERRRRLRRTLDGVGLTAAVE